ADQLLGREAGAEERIDRRVHSEREDQQDGGADPEAAAARSPRDGGDGREREHGSAQVRAQRPRRLQGRAAAGGEELAEVVARVGRSAEKTPPTAVDERPTE